MSLAIAFTYVLFRKGKLSIEIDSFALLIGVGAACLVVLVIGQFIWRGNEHSLLMIAPIFIFILLVFCNSSYLKASVFHVVLLVVMLALYEKITGRYIFVGLLELNGVEVSLDENLYSGAAGDLRAKSIFNGPLTMSAFLLSAAIILRNSKLAIFLCGLGSVLAISRTSMILVPMILFFSYFSKFQKNYTIRFLMFFLFLLTAFVFVSLAAPQVLQKIGGSLDFSGGSETNSARLYYWLSGWQEYRGYELDKILLGDNGYYRSVYGNNAESGWLTLLLDFGLVGFLIYFLPLVFVLFKRHTLDVALMVGILIVANMVFTLCYGVTGCFVYWLTIYFLLKGDRKHESCNSP